jgi:hypothetical protein
VIFLSALDHCAALEVTWLICLLESISASPQVSAGRTRSKSDRVSKLNWGFFGSNAFSGCELKCSPRPGQQQLLLQLLQLLHALVFLSSTYEAIYLCRKATLSL